MSSKQKETTTTHQVQGPEQWMQDEGSSLYNDAAAAIPKTFKKYTGERVADYGDDYYDARDLVRGMSADTPEMDQFKSVLDQLYNKDSEYLKGSTQDHMDPYLEAVLNPQLRKLNEARELQLGEDNRAATMSGAFGDPQAGIARALTTDRFNTQLSDATGSAYSKAWNDAQNQENHVAGRFAETGKGYAGLDQALFNKKTALSQFLTKFGLADQDLAQKRDDVKYDDWKMAKQGGWQMLRGTNLMNLLNNTPHDTISDGKSEKETDDGGAGFMQMIGKLAGAAIGAATGNPAAMASGAASIFGGGAKSGGGGDDGGFNMDASRASMGMTNPSGGFSWSPDGYFRT